MGKRLASSICQSLSSNYIKDDIKSKPTLSAEYEIVAVAFELRDKNTWRSTWARVLIGNDKSHSWTGAGKTRIND